MALKGAVMAVLTACSSSAKKIEKSAHTVRSWTATADATTNALAAGSVPRVYGVQIRGAAEQARRQAVAQAEWESLPAHTRRELEQAITRLQFWLASGDTTSRDE
ncbi:MAG TPA: hypothetical protein VKA25_02015 [Gemmatimonadales bacterium]|nr:hypothetical protein [Gemmatimonadales bacterium]